METTHFTYFGRPALAGALAQELETRGVSVNYHPPVEKKDLALALTVVAVAFAATGPVKDIVAGVRAFTARFSGTRVEGLPDEGPSLRERLAQLDELKADGTVTDDEYARQRARILGDL
jgi:hypothetical protein